MTQLTQEQIRNEMLSLFEEHEGGLKFYESEIGAIEDEVMKLFDEKVAIAKKELIADITIADEQLEKKFFERVELIRKSIMQDLELKIKDLDSKVNLQVKD